MAVRSTLLALRSDLTGTVGRQVLIVPPGRTAIVKSVIMQNRTGASSTLVMNVRRGTHTVAFCRDVVANEGVIRYAGLFVVIEAGGELVTDSSVAGGTYGCIVSGAMLLGDPE